MVEDRTAGGRIATVAVIDTRSMPVSVVRHVDTDRIAAMFDGRRLPIARSVYFAVVQLVAEADGLHGEASRKDLAALAGVGVRTLDEVMTALVDAELLHKVLRREDGLNLPNLYGLGPEGGAAQSTTHMARGVAVADDTQQSSSTAPARGKKKDGGSLPTLPGLSLGFGDDGGWVAIDDVAVTPDLLQDAGELLGRKRKVGSQIVTPQEMALAVVVIAEFNRQADAEFGVGAHLIPIVGRIRERPSYDAAAHVRLVQSAWRLRWWERNGKKGRRATPAVIYGNAGVFEQVVQDAVDEKKGRARAEGPAAESSSRFDRED